MPVASQTESEAVAGRAQILRAWLPAIAWIGVIAIESTGLLGSSNTASLLFPLLRWLAPHMPLEQMQEVHHILRKTGHVVGYGLLSWLCFRAWRATLTSGRPPDWNWRWAALALAMTATVASLDELHQYFTPGRTGLFCDVVLDTSAGLLVQLILFLLLRRRRGSSHHSLGIRPQQ